MPSHAEEEVANCQAHNGLLILTDGSIVTKDLRLTACSTLTRLDPNTLEDCDAPLLLPEPSMGRIAAVNEWQGVHICARKGENLSPDSP